MNLLLPPEAADGGYWFVTTLGANAEGQTVPDGVAGLGAWSAWYQESSVLVKSLTVCSVRAIDPTPAYLSLSSKPFSRMEAPR